jgi:hypothetical protein
MRMRVNAAFLAYALSERGVRLVESAIAAGILLLYLFDLM